MTNKEKQLKKLEREMRLDKKLAFSTNLVFGDGPVSAEIVFIGEAPGAKEDLEELPFVGRSGKLLDTALENIGLKRKDVYITNIVKRRPPENRDPSILEIEAYRPYLKKQLEIIKPKIIVTLGRFSMNYFLPEAKMMQDQGTIFNLEKFSLIPVIHPAAAMRSKKNLKNFNDSFLKLKDLLNKNNVK